MTFLIKYVNASTCTILQIQICIISSNSRINALRLFKKRYNKPFLRISQI